MTGCPVIGRVDAGPLAEGGVQILQLVAGRAAVTDDDPPGVGGEDGQHHTVDARHVTVAGSTQRTDAAAGAQRRHQPAQSALMLVIRRTGSRFGVHHRPLSCPRPASRVLPGSWRAAPPADLTVVFGTA